MSNLSFPQLICPVAIWITLVCFFTSICFAAKEGMRKLKRLHQIPCSHCTFSTEDYRLKCAVRPCQAFSEEAVYCPDFEKRQRIQWTTKVKKLTFKTIRLLKNVRQKAPKEFG